MKNGICYLVGAGPGDPGLLTLKARELISQAEVLAYDALVSPEILSWANSAAEKIYVGKRANRHAVPQDQISDLLIDRTRSGKMVVRLKGGDPFVFGRGGEEALALAAEGLRWEMVPGITSGIAAPAYAGIPVSHRAITSSITFITGHEQPGKTDDAIDWSILARLNTTLVIYMGMERLGIIADTLIRHGKSPQTPCAVMQWGTTPHMRTLTSQLCKIADDVVRANLGAPAIVLIGDVAALHEKLSWRDHLPLLGQRIVLTRTRNQSSKMKQVLQKAGAEVWELPLIRISSVDSLPAAMTSGTLNQLFDWLVFTSPNAADAFFKAYLKLCDIRQLGSVKIAVVGPATATAVTEFGLHPDFISPINSASGLVNAWNENKHYRILFPCSQLASDEIEKGLSAKGCSVERLEVYQTLPETDDPSNVRERLASEGANWVVFASSSAAEQWVAQGIPKTLPQMPQIASFGPMTSAALKAAGLPVTVESPEPSPNAMTKSIADYLSSTKLTP